MLGRLNSLPIVACLCISSTAAAQAPVKRDPQALSALRQAFSLMGGANLGAIRDTSCTVTLTQTQTKQTTTLVLTTLGNEYLKTERQGSLETKVLTGNQFVTRDENGDIRRAPSRSFSAGGPFHIPVLLLQRRLDDLTATVEYVGLEQTVTGALHHMRLRPALPKEGTPGVHDSPLEFFVDASTHVLIRIVYRAHSPSNLKQSVPVEVTFGDYRRLLGIVVPYRISLATRGVPYAEFEVQSCVANQGITESSFEVR